jgi:hypothetical protein
VRRSLTYPLRQRLDRLLCVVALLGIALLPVEYRAGADTPHLHASFQLWWDAAHGSTEHHPWREAGALSAAPERAANPGPLRTDRPEGPGLSKLTTLIEYPAMLTAPLLLFTLALGATRGWPAARRLVGRLLAPEPPPPRGLATPI